MKELKQIPDLDRIEAVKLRDVDGFHSHYVNIDYFQSAQIKSIFNTHNAPHEVPNFRGIKVQFVPPTNERGCRIRFYEDARGSSDKKQSKILSLNNKPGEHLSEYAYRILKSNGFIICGRYSDVDTITFLCNNWDVDFIEIKDIKS